MQRLPNLFLETDKTVLVPRCPTVFSVTDKSDTVYPGKRGTYLIKRTTFFTFIPTCFPFPIAVEIVYSEYVALDDVEDPSGRLAFT